MSNFQISTLQSKIADGTGLFRYNRYVASIAPPTTLTTAYDTKSLSFLCSATNLPGKSIATADQRYGGAIRRIARETIYAEITLSFYLTQSLGERKFFEDWMEYINPQGTYNVEYYNNYVGTIEIYTYKDTNELTSLGTNNAQYGVRLQEAFPIGLDPVGLNWNLQNDAATTNVTFAYREWSRVS